VAQGRDDIRVEFAHHSRAGGSPIPLDRGEPLVAAGLLMITGHVDLDELDR
jgi:hypothetical protein